MSAVTRRGTANTDTRSGRAVDPAERFGFSQRKRYADFTKSFDTGLKEIVDGIANVTNANQGRIEEIEYHVDWAQDWTWEDGLFILRYTLIEHSKELPFTILTEIIVACNREATAR